MDWDTFDHDEYFASPEPEPQFASDDRDPIIEIPDDEEDGDQASAMDGSHPWHTRQPSEEVWHEIWSLTDRYTPYIVCANLDTGVNPHQILPKPLDEVSMIGGQSPRDGNGHGTHTASTTVGNDQMHGVAPGTQLLVVKVLSNGGSGSSSGIARGINWAVDWRGSDGLACDVINMSLGGGSRYAPSINAIVRGHSRATHTNCSAGNSGPRQNSEGYPARDPAVNSIGAYASSGSIASFSSRGKITVACPGQGIVGASNRSQTGLRSMSGTSMSCPFKSGLDCLLIAYRRASGLPNWRSRDVMVDVYKKYSVDAGSPGYDSAFGHGAPSIAKMLEDMALYKRNFFTKVL